MGILYINLYSSRNDSKKIKKNKQVNKANYNIAQSCINIFHRIFRTDYNASVRLYSLPMKIRREATGRMITAVKTAQSGWRHPAISSRNSNTSHAYRMRFPTEHRNTLCHLYRHIHSFNALKNLIFTVGEQRNT